MTQVDRQRKDFQIKKRKIDIFCKKITINKIKINKRWVKKQKKLVFKALEHYLIQNQLDSIQQKIIEIQTILNQVQKERISESRMDQHDFRAYLPKRNPPKAPKTQAQGEKTSQLMNQIQHQRQYFEKYAQEMVHKIYELEQKVKKISEEQTQSINRDEILLPKIDGFKQTLKYELHFKQFIGKKKLNSQLEIQSLQSLSKNYQHFSKEVQNLNFQAERIHTEDQHQLSLISNQSIPLQLMPAGQIQQTFLEMEEDINHTKERIFQKFDEWSAQEKKMMDQLILMIDRIQK